MRHSIYTGLAPSALLLAALLLAGCDTASHGSSPSDGSQPSTTSVDGDRPAPAEVDGDRQPDQVASAADGEIEAVTAEPMPRPVRGGDGEVVEVNFDDVNLKMQADMVFRPWLLTDRVKELEGRRIRITGVVHAREKLKGLTEFVLLKNIQCKFGPGGQADHLVTVKMKDGESTDYVGDQPVSVEGVLRVNPFQGPDGNTWSIYDLESADKVKTERR